VAAISSQITYLRLRNPERRVMSARASYRGCASDSKVTTRVRISGGEERWTHGLGPRCRWPSN